jgi:nicotinate (nicotinamide) nucleotide adenylyltransferase
LAEKIRIAIFRGSFDPFHNEHKMILEELIKLNKFAQIIVMPLGLAPHANNYLTPDGYRREMARLGIRNMPGIILSDYEINRPGQYSYTIDTIDYYKRKIRDDYLKEKAKVLSKQGNTEGKKTGKSNDVNGLKSIQDVKVVISLVYDSNVLDTIVDWYQPEKIMKKAKLLIYRRESDNFRHLNERADYLRTKYQAKIDFLEIKETDISSAELREKLRLNQAQKDKIPSAVYKYIKNNQIYRFSQEMAQLSQQQLIQLAVYEKEVRRHVSLCRLNHSLNVMQYAVHLAARHDYDLMKAAVTGILHDIAKSMKLKVQYRFAKTMGKLSPLNRNIVHGPAGAWYAQRFLGIADPEILDALTFHTTSRKDMTKLDKIIYLADKLEHGRPIREFEKVREIAETDLTAAMKLCLEEVRLSQIRRSKKRHPSTKAARKHLESK